MSYFSYPKPILSFLDCEEMGTNKNNNNISLYRTFEEMEVNKMHDFSS